MKKNQLQLIPTVFILFTIGILPLFYTILLSFQKLMIKTPWLNQSFVNVQNYLNILNDQQFIRALIHTICFVWITLTIEIILGFLLAFCLYRALLGKNYLVQLGLFLPLVTPAVLSAQMWRLFFHDADGLLNHLLHNLGIQPIAWLSDPYLAWIAIGTAELWRVTPFVTVIFLASLLTIPKEVWEAASLDGAKGWSLMRFITIPLMRSTFLVIILFRMLDGLRVFDLVYVMTQGGPGGATDVMALYVYRSLFSELALGKGSAASLVMLLIACFFSSVIYLIFRKKNA